VRSLAVPAVALALLGASHARLGIQSGTVRGHGFKGHERVTIVIRVRTDSPVTRHATASQAGTFAVPIAGGYPCGHFQISATGTSGSRATLAGIKLPRCEVG
jgi:hypothetical protein